MMPPKSSTRRCSPLSTRSRPRTRPRSGGHGDAQSMVESIQSLAKSHPVQSSRLTAAARKFAAFVQFLQPYFDVVEIFVQVKPDVMALIWGLLKMIFKVTDCRGGAAAQMLNGC